MKVKVLLAILTFIMCVFAIKGINTVNRVNESYNLSYAQVESATSDIGLCFDWYGITIVDTAVKYSNGIIDSAQATKALTDGSKNNIKLLDQYYTNVLPQEKDAANFIYAQDVLSKKLTEELLLLISKNDREGVTAKIPEMYAIVDPMCSSINDIIEIKTEAAKTINTGIQGEIKEVKTFMIISFALCISLCSGIALKS